MVVIIVLMIRPENSSDIHFFVVNSVNVPLMMYGNFVWLNLIWPDRCLIWPEKVG